jgi:hypothetical protein
MLQGALSREELPAADTFPILVTFSRHDHANGFLFPIANIPLNAYTCTLAGDSVGLNRPDLSEYSLLPREVARMVVSPVLSSLFLPLDYLTTQMREFLLNSNWLPETLAQLPGTEVLVDAVDWAARDDTFVDTTGVSRRRVRWNASGKGVFNAGSVTEAVGRCPNPGLGSMNPPELFSITDIASARRLPARSGVILIDCSSVIRESAVFGVDLSNLFLDYTLSWVDPIGAHEDVNQTELYKLMDVMFANAVNAP